MPPPEDDDKPASVSGQSEPSISEGKSVSNGIVADEVGAENDDANDSSQEHKFGGDDLDPSSVSFTAEKLKIDLALNILPKHDEEASNEKLGCSTEHVPTMLTRNQVAIESHVKDDSNAKRSNALPFTKSGSLTPRQRPRSLSPTAELEDRAKRSAIICDFYAKGWCIKGSSCMFLHEKVIVDNSGSPSGRDLGVAGKGEFMEQIGFGQGVTRSRLCTELPSSAGSDLIATRLLVREYGGAQTQQFEPEPIPRNDPRVIPPVKEVLLRDSVRHDSSMLNHELLIQPWAREEFRRLDTLGKGWSSRYPLNELEQARLHQENYDQPHKEHISGKCNSPINIGPEKREVLYDKMLRREYPCDLSNSLPDYKLASSCFAYESSRGETTIKPHGRLSLYEEYLSSSSPLNSSYSISRSNNSLSVFGTSSSRGFSPLSTELLDDRILLDGEKEYYTRRSSSFSRSSSPYQSRRDEDLPISSGFKTKSFSSDWEPSVPFRSSFCPPIGVSSSPGNQYDPIIDSMEPSNGGTEAYQTSTINSYGTVIQHLPHQMTNGSDVVLDKNISRTKPDVNIALEATAGDAQDGRPKEDKIMMSKERKEHKKHLEEVGVQAKSKGEADGSKHDKESKALKIFRITLVDYVKELVRPSWRGGHLSKDAHKAIVRKAVDKVLSTLQPYQIPSTDDSINQYLSSSRSKLSRLVEGYVEKYTKARAADS
ncbi:protein FRIGIDA-ESSENTIAL 1-like isoform X2 [Aristolochia californica]|uniref:protein FRIGIDA-ESSENTIAL 1-like isoform X2 n=1 Tax=Aristolochia californica TaxID=171875 RepID=UPI0035DC1ED4